MGIERKGKIGTERKGNEENGTQKRNRHAQKREREVGS